MTKNEKWYDKVIAPEGEMPVAFYEYSPELLQAMRDGLDNQVREGRRDSNGWIVDFEVTIDGVEYRVPLGDMGQYLTLWALAKGGTVNYKLEVPRPLTRLNGTYFQPGHCEEL